MALLKKRDFVEVKVGKNIVNVPRKENVNYNPFTSETNLYSVGGHMSRFSQSELHSIEEEKLSRSALQNRARMKKTMLKSDHLSQEYYQKAKKLKGFNKGDWEWNSDTKLYDKIK